MSLFNQDGLFDIDYYKQHRNEFNARANVSTIGQVFNTCIKRIEPKYDSLVKKNFTVDLDVNARTFTLKTLPIEEQDVDVKYSSLTAVYTYSEGSFQPILDEFEIPDTIQVYEKDANDCAEYLSRVFNGASANVEYDGETYLSHYPLYSIDKQAGRIYNLHANGMVTAGDGYEIIGTGTRLVYNLGKGNDFNQSATAGCLCRDRNKQVTFKILPNPTVDTVDTGLSGGDLGLRQSDLTGNLP